MMLSTFVFLSVYVLFSYMFVAGVAAEMGIDKQSFKPIVRILAPVYMPYVVGVCLMSAQRVNKKIISRMKLREDKRKFRIDRKINEQFKKDLKEMGEAMQKAVVDAHPEIFYGIGQHAWPLRPFRYNTHK